MSVIEISVALPAEIEQAGKKTTTGIFKRPVAGPCYAGHANLDGDGQADLAVHGGRDKALYLYSHDYYPLWARELGRPTLEPAQFGENLTVAGCRDEDVVLGSILRIGAIEVTVMQPRIPCFKLGLRLGEPDFPNRFWTAGRLGFYARVETPGLVDRGDAVEVLDTPAHGITARELWRTVMDRHEKGARRAMELLPGLDAGWQKRLRLAGAAGPG